jgi:hypothetical protein
MNNMFWHNVWRDKNVEICHSHLCKIKFNNTYYQTMFVGDLVSWDDNFKHNVLFEIGCQDNS